MNERITIILLTNGFRYSGTLIKEDQDFISILDYKTKSEMSFPKKMVMITREAL